MLEKCGAEKSVYTAQAVHAARLQGLTAVTDETKKDWNTIFETGNKVGLL